MGTDTEIDSCLYVNVVVIKSVSVILRVERIVVVSTVPLVSVTVEMRVFVTKVMVLATLRSVSVVIVGVVESAVIVVETIDGTKLVEVNVRMPDPRTVVNIVVEY